ncbi:hypothetical protein F5146DRAFT_1004427 [Armillaria mellea]|nr:hypothetical protein F5146DRAFT_1004427 [Armillaria mellea]
MDGITHGPSIRAWDHEVPMFSGLSKFALTHYPMLSKASEFHVGDYAMVIFTIGGYCTQDNMERVSLNIQLAIVLEVHSDRDVLAPFDSFYEDFSDETPIGIDDTTMMESLYLYGEVMVVLYFNCYGVLMEHVSSRTGAILRMQYFKGMALRLRHYWQIILDDEALIKEICEDEEWSTQSQWVSLNLDNLSNKHTVSSNRMKTVNLVLSINMHHVLPLWTSRSPRT